MTSYMSVEALLGDYSTALSCFCNLLLIAKTKLPEGETGTLPTLPMFIFVFSQFMLPRYLLLAMSNDFLDIVRFLAVSSALAIYISKPWDG